MEDANLVELLNQKALMRHRRERIWSFFYHSVSFVGFVEGSGKSEDLELEPVQKIVQFLDAILKIFTIFIQYYHIPPAVVF